MAKGVAGETARDLRNAASAVTAAADHARGELRGVSWWLVLGAFLLGLVAGDVLGGWFAWAKLDARFDEVVNNQGALWQAVKPPAGRTGQLQPRKR